MFGLSSACVPQPWRFTYLSPLLIFLSRLVHLSWKKEEKSKWRWLKNRHRFLFTDKLCSTCFNSMYLCPWQGKGAHKTYWLLNKRGFNPPVIPRSSSPTDSLKLEVQLISPSFEITTASRDKSDTIYPSTVSICTILYRRVAIWPVFVISLL